MLTILKLVWSGLLKGILNTLKFLLEILEKLWEFKLPALISVVLVLVGLYFYNSLNNELKLVNTNLKIAKEKVTNLEGELKTTKSDLEIQSKNVTTLKLALADLSEKNRIAGEESDKYKAKVKSTEKVLADVISKRDKFMHDSTVSDASKIDLNDCSKGLEWIINRSASGYYYYQ